MGAFVPDVKSYKVPGKRQSEEDESVIGAVLVDVVHSIFVHYREGIT